MAYSDFALAEVLDKFDLSDRYERLFPNLVVREQSLWLKETLSMALRMALPGGSEKARSEFLIAPILLDVAKEFNHVFFIHSGKNLDVSKQDGLVGECDFILSKSDSPLIIRAPIFALMEAKKDNIEAGIGQCAGQIYGAKVLNERNKEPIHRVYGCVTTGETWQFLKLEKNTIYIDLDRYYIDQIEQILGCLHYIVSSFLE